MTIFKVLSFAVALTMTAGCLSDLASFKEYPGPTVTVLQANECTTAGAAYTMSFSEVSDGTCGPLANEGFAVSADGHSSTSVSWTPIVCAKETQAKCDSQERDCYWRFSGETCSVMTDLTYLKDGTSATGFRTLSCKNIPVHINDGGPDSGTVPEGICNSSYHVTITRQAPTSK